MKRSILIRFILLLSVWVPLAVLCIQYGIQEKDKTRLDALILSNGVISSVQQESWFFPVKKIKTFDRILWIGGKTFDVGRVKEWLSRQEPERMAKVIVERNGEKVTAEIKLRTYKRSAFFALFIIPFILSLIFLCFALSVPLQRFTLRRSREAGEIFAAFCFGISLFFLSFFPTLTLGTPLSFSVALPILGAMLLHLFIVYPKKKGNRYARWGFLSSVYSVAGTISVLETFYWATSANVVYQKLNFIFLCFCLLASIFALGNTLFTSRDFWARRRARLMSVMSLLMFIGLLSVFVTFFWEQPQLSVERILAVSLFFPTAFAVIFLKSNVFDLERIFRRGLHQLLLLAMAITLALLVGLAWSEWDLVPEKNWILWAMIAIAVMALTRPVGHWLENKLHSVIQTRVKYPQVDLIFNRSPSLEVFMRSFCKHCDVFLNMKNIRIRFYQDPTNPWNEKNEECWKFRDGIVIRDYSVKTGAHYTAKMEVAGKAIGEFLYDGGDAIAFDPHNSREWAQTMRSFSRCMEILSLREFIALQQGVLAVGRMQALLAHEMKNPLAIVKVCAGLLNTHVVGDEEAEELVKTIQDEVSRVAEGVQNVFDHSGRGEEKQKINLSLLLNQIKETVAGRFADRVFEVQFCVGGSVSKSKEGLLWLWVEKEGLRQSITNLVINAYEAGSQWVKVKIDLDDDKFSILVEDGGPGFSKNMELFKPFVTTKPKGTGLGLAHVKAFMDRNNGQIQVNSKPGEGTSFVLEFSSQFVMNKEV
jgi:signal transduction histidine kinase